MKRPRKKSLDELLSVPLTAAGRKAALKEIRKHGGSTYGTGPRDPGVIIERKSDGTTPRGTIVNRVFVPLE